MLLEKTSPKPSTILCRVSILHRDIQLYTLVLSICTYSINTYRRKNHGGSGGTCPHVLNFVGALPHKLCAVTVPWCVYSSMIFGPDYLSTFPEKVKPQIFLGDMPPDPPSLQLVTPVEHFASTMISLFLHLCVSFPAVSCCPFMFSC